MPEKKRKDKEPEKKRPGRPRILSPELDNRFQIRCSHADEDAWRERATKLGFPSPSAWIRKMLNDALKQPVR